MRTQESSLSFCSTRPCAYFYTNSVILLYLLLYVYSMYTRLSTEVILTSAFGRAKNIQDSKEDDKLVVSVKNIFDAQNDRSGVHGSFIIKYLSKQVIFYSV